MRSPRIGVVNRYTAKKRRRYPLGLALNRSGHTYVPIDVREINASLGEQGAPQLTLAGGDEQQGTSLEELKLDGIAWRVSEGAFHAYADIQGLLARRYALVNDWACARICVSKWKTSLRLAAADIRVVPTILLVPGMKVPAFSGTETVIKPCTGARGRGVRVAEAGTGPGIIEPHVAQPLLPGAGAASAGTGMRVLLGAAHVPAGHVPRARRARRPEGSGGQQPRGRGVPVSAPAEPVRDIALAAAECLDGDLLGVDLVRRGVGGSGGERIPGAGRHRTARRCGLLPHRRRCRHRPDPTLSRRRCHCPGVTPLRVRLRRRSATIRRQR